MGQRPPYTCKQCGKQMWSLVEVVEDWRSTDVYCQQCGPDRRRVESAGQGAIDTGLNRTERSARYRPASAEQRRATSDAGVDRAADRVVSTYYSRFDFWAILKYAVVCAAWLAPMALVLYAIAVRWQDLLSFWTRLNFIHKVMTLGFAVGGTSMGLMFLIGVLATAFQIRTPERVGRLLYLGVVTGACAFFGPIIIAWSLRFFGIWNAALFE